MAFCHHLNDGPVVASSKAENFDSSFRIWIYSCVFHSSIHRAGTCSLIAAALRCRCTSGLQRLCWLVNCPLQPQLFGLSPGALVVFSLPLIPCEVGGIEISLRGMVLSSSTFGGGGWKQNFTRWKAEQNGWIGIGTREFGAVGWDGHFLKSSGRYLKGNRSMMEVVLSVS